MKKYKLDTEISFNGRFIDIQLQGDYYSGEELCPELPFKDEMELTKIVTRVYFNPELNGQYREINIHDLFEQKELEAFADLLYSNGEPIEQ